MRLRVLRVHALREALETVDGDGDEGLRRDGVHVDGVLRARQVPLRLRQQRRLQVRRRRFADVVRHSLLVVAVE